MAERVKVRSLAGNQVEATNGKSRVVLDLAKESGGQGEGLDPHETLLSALGGCTTMTLLGYARRKGWPLEGVDLELSHEKPPSGQAGPERITVAIGLTGALDDSQRARLLEIAAKCPVNKTLSGELEIVEQPA